MLLVFRSNRTAAAKFTVGTTVQLESNWQPDLKAYPHILGGGPLLIQQGRIVLDAAAEKFSPAFITEAAPRSSIGRTQGGDVLLVSVQNAPDGKEPTLTNIAQIMQQLGAVDALNLDGGSSTTLYLGGQILDRAPRSSARVHDAIGIFLP
jgi:exopolysaccharide biosynthesis protein